jgi:hypothetical protein
MGLAERRAITEYQEKKFPEVKKNIQAAAGFPVNLDIRWDTMADPNAVNEYADCFQKVYFTPLIDAFKAVASDDMGKKSLKSGLKKVVIDGSDGTSPQDFKFVGGELTLQHKPFTNLQDVSLRTKGIQKLLEDNL